MSDKESKLENEPLQYIEEKIGSEWVRIKRFGFALHPRYARTLVKELKKYHKANEYRLVSVPEVVIDDDIPF